MRETSHAIPLAYLIKNVVSVPTSEVVYNPNWGGSLFRRSEIYKSPKWKLRRKYRGTYVPPTNYSCDFDMDTGWVGTRTGYTPGGYFLQLGAMSIGITQNNTELPLIGNVHEQAIIRALNNLKDQNVNLAVAFAERGKTSAMMLKTATDIVRAGKALKRGDLKKVHKIFKLKKPRKSRIPACTADEMPKRWLEYQYGWQPLLMDLDGACQDLAERDLDASRYRVSAIGRVEDKSISVSSYSTSAFDVKGFHKLKRTTWVRFDYTMSDSPALSQAAALGLTNPASVAWELLPFSFIADWFVPIGDWLNCLDADLGFDFLGGCSVDVTENDSIFAAKFNNGYPGFCTSRSHKWNYVRQAYGSTQYPRFPGLTVKSPTNKNVASALSILAGFFS